MKQSKDWKGKKIADKIKKGKKNLISGNTFLV